MSCCQTCSRRETTLIHERNNLAKFTRFLCRRRDDPTPRQLAELDKIKSHVATAEKFLAEHQAECDA